MKPMKQNLKIFSGDKTIVEKEYEDFRKGLVEKQDVFYAQTSVTTIEDEGIVKHFYHIFLFYE